MREREQAIEDPFFNSLLVWQSLALQASALPRRSPFATLAACEFPGSN
jgi:hypothetical protein